ncbi:MAG: FAD-binding protein [Candidatus Riflebacteria bacterium]|nr:FAD-binding protein [Candidatus Riflebacteria bacterium]
MSNSRGISRRLADRISDTVGSRWCLGSPEERWAYSYDGSLARAAPDLVVLPGSEEEVAQVVRLCHNEGVPFVARGAGTGLSGGSVAIVGGVVIGLARLDRILEIDPDDLLAIVEPGVVNLDLCLAAARHGLAFMPDPASQKVSTIGGNVANNAGGPHCLAYGVTTQHVIGLTVVLPDGERIDLGGPLADVRGYDLTGLYVGSEGTLGIVTRIICRLCPRRESTVTLLAAFSAMEPAAAAVTRIISEGIVPTALEMMDGPIIRAIEESFHAGYPVEASAILLVEVEGLAEGLASVSSRIRTILDAAGPMLVREATSEGERQRLWAGRKGALGAVARLNLRYHLQDGVVPRSRLPSVLERVAAIGRELDLSIVNVFHAGDGNLHPLILFDPDDPDQMQRATVAAERIIRSCVEAGGTLTGEHGLGLEKNNWMGWLYTAEDLAVMKRVKDALDPRGIANPGKLLPSPLSAHQPLAAPDLSAGGPR